MSDISGFDIGALPVHKQEEFFVSTHNETEIVTHIQEHFANAKSAFVRMGMALYYTRQKYGPRSENWALVRERLSFSKSTITKLIAIGADERIRRSDVFPFLPDSWGTIYLVTRLTDTEIYQGINGGDIHPEASRKEVARFLADVKQSGDLSSQPPRIPGLDRLFYENDGDQESFSSDAYERRPDEDQDTWAKRVLWFNKEIKSRTRPLFNVRIDFNLIDYENARKAIELSKALRKLPHVYTAEVNEFAIRRLEERALDEFVKRMDVISNIIENVGPDSDPISLIAAGLSGDDEKLLGHLDSTHPLLAVIREEFDTRVVGKDPRTPIPIPLRDRLAKTNPFGDDEYGANWMLMLKWIQAMESDDREDWEKVDSALDDGLTVEDIFDGPLDAGLDVSDENEK